MKLVAVIYIITILNSFAAKSDLVKVEAAIDADGISFKVVITNRKIVYISNPDKRNVSLNFEGENHSLIGSKTYEPPKSENTSGWQHLVVLIKPREAPASIGYFRFSVSDKSNTMMKHVRYIHVTLWMADEEAFKKDGITSLKPFRIPAKIVSNSYLRKE